MAKKKSFSKNANIGISFLVVALVALVAAVASIIILPRVAPEVKPEKTDIVSIVADNDGIISVDADMSKVFATVKFSNGSVRKVPLTELIVTGLDTSEAGVLKNVVLDYGGFKQVVQYEVVPTFLDIKYTASTGGRVIGDLNQKVPAGKDASRVQAVPDEGYYFEEWSDGNPNASRLDRQVSASRETIAVFKKLRYTVVFFYPDGTTAREEWVLFGDAPTKVPRPDEQNMRLYGYRFIGFDKDFSSISGHTEIFPLYEKYATDTFIEYTVDAEGIPLGTSNALPYYEKDKIASIRVTANPDRLFTGWSIKDIDGKWISMQPNGERKLIKLAPNHNVAFATARTGTSDEYAITFTPDAAVDSLYIKAHFSYVESEITFTSMSVKAREPILIRHDQEIGQFFDVEDLSTMTLLGYDFKGWAVKDGPVDENGKPILIKNTHKFTQPTELVAQWEKKLYEVIFLTGQNENPDFRDEARGYDPAVGGRVLRAYYQDSLVSAIPPAVFPTEPVYYTNHTFKGWYILGEDLQPTNIAVDKTHKIDRELTYVMPVFEVNKVKLNISILEGAGSVVNLATDPDNPASGDIEVPIRGIFSMAVNQIYKFRIKPANGYRITEVTIGDITQAPAPEDDVFNFTITHPQSDRLVKVRFKKAQYVIHIANGQVGAQGTITYNDENSETGYVAVSDSDINIYASHGSNKNIEILAEDGKYIISVVVGGINQAVPYLATYHVVNLSSISSNTPIIITYREFRYRVSVPVPSELENGTVALIDAQTDYPKNSTPILNIEAESGYYIKYIRVNGWDIDPYQPPEGFSVTNIEILGNIYVEGNLKDDRITRSNISINEISRDAVVTAKFERIYHTIKVSHDGPGISDDSKIVLSGGNIDIQATTTEGNYISGVVIDGENQVLVGLRTSIVQTFTAVNADHTIHFVFTHKKLAITFEPSVGVTVTQKSIKYDISEGKTFTNISSGSNNTFIIETGSGTQIDAIKYYAGDNAADINDENIAFNATSHVLQFDAIRKDYVVSVITKPLLRKVSLHMLNKKNSGVYLNSANTGSLATYDASVSYGENVTIEIQPDLGLLIDIDSINVSNIDVRETYKYTKTTVLNPEIEQGQYFIYQSSGSYILILARVNTDIDVFINFRDETPSYSVHTETPTNGTLEVTDHLGNVITDSTTIQPGASLTYTMVPNAGYSLLSLMINGVKVPNERIVGGKYEATMGDSPQFVSAVFVRTRYSVTIDSVDTNGSVTIEYTVFNEGSTFEIKVTARKGYTVKTMSVTVGNATPTPIDVGNGKEIFVYNIPTSMTVADITIKATFAAKLFNLTLEKTGNGSISEDLGIKEISYGSRIPINIIADDYHYISAIMINNVEYSTWDLSNRLVNYDTEEVERGVLDFELTETTSILFVFSPNRYKINAVADLNGVTLFKKVSPGGVTSPFLPANQLYTSSGDVVWIRMTANQGYHVSSLTLNGVLVTNWKSSSARDNDLQDIYFELATVTANIRVEVVYTINSYAMIVNAFNTSVNFKSFDVTPLDYGRVSIVGFQPNENNEYTGFAHGSNIRVFIQPRTARGYYIDRFSIRFADGTERIIGESELPRNGGSYIIYNLVTDIDELRVEFKRRLFTFELSHVVNQLGAPWPWIADGVKVSFYNPYSRDVEIVIVDGSYYEFGTTYEISLLPSAGYSRTMFTFNDEDRMEYIRLNKYLGVVTSNIEAKAEFTLNTFDVLTEQNLGGVVKIRDESGKLLWAEGVTIVQEGDPIPPSGEYVLHEITTTRGRLWVYPDKLVATYGTDIRIIVTPNNTTNGVSDQGYRIGSFSVNGMSMSFAGDAESVYEGTIRGNVSTRVSFVINNYVVSIRQFEGGSAVASPNEVVWGNSSVITATITKGYFISAVKINGAVFEPIYAGLSANRRYVLLSITENKDIEIIMERNRYDVSFGQDSDYKTEFSINNGERTLTAVSGVVINENVPGRVPQTFSTNIAGTINNEGVIVSTNQTTGEYVGLRYGDKLVYKLTVPEGFEFISISVYMDDIGINETQILNSTAGLDVDDGSGKRTFTINNVTGNVRITFKYRLKTYNVLYVGSPHGEFTDLSITNVAHHQRVSWSVLANYGYYMSKLEINGISYFVDNNTLTYEKVASGDNYVYRYSTALRDSANNLIDREISYTMLNGDSKLRIVPFFAPLYFNISIQVNNSTTNPNLQVSIRNNRIVYDPDLKATFNHVLMEGYSINSIEFKDTDGYGAQTYALTLNTDSVLEDSEFNPKDAVLSIPTRGRLIDNMDFHSPYYRTIRMYYLISQDTHEIQFNYHLISSVYDDITFTYKNKGVSLANDGDVPRENGQQAFVTTKDFTDNIAPSAPHAHGVYAMFTTTVAPIAQDKYEFSGFQEKIGDTWRYITMSSGELELMSGGRTMRLRITNNRQFRAVFFRLYKINVEVKPEFKYTQGSFATSEPNLMTYRLYSSVFATAQHFEDLENDVVLPNISSPSNVELEEKSIEKLNGRYEFLVRSGAMLTLKTLDRLPIVNNSRGYDYYNISYVEGSYSQGSGTIDYERGVFISDDKLVYSYARNNVYTSFAMETVGAFESNAGGTISYLVNGSPAALSNNSLITQPDSTVEFIIRPKDNYRFDAASILEFMPRASEDGYRRNTGVFKPLVNSPDGKITITYYGLDFNNPVNPATYMGRISAVRVVMKHLSENNIIKVRFWKQIEFNRVVSIMTDEGISTSIVNKRPNFIDPTSENGTYDFADNVTLKINMPEPAYIDWNIRWQFVGVFVNGVNLTKNINQAYPTNTDLVIKLDDTAQIADKIVDGRRVFAVDVVARFVPVYNIVVENDYMFDPPDSEENIYLDPKEISVSTVTYSSTLMRYSKDETPVRSRTSDSDHGYSHAIQMLGKLNKNDGNKNVASSPYNTWNNNMITLNWTGAGLAGPTYKFLGWQYYMYDENSQSYRWDNIPYIENIGGNAGVMDYRRPSYTFPISALASSSYFRVFTNDGLINILAAKTSVWRYDSATNTWIETPNVMAIRIRPRFQKIVPVEIIKEVASQSPDVFSTEGSGGIRPVIMENSLPAASFAYYHTIVMDPAIRTGYEFAGWYYRAGTEEYVQLNDTSALALKPIGTTGTSISYQYNETSKRITIRLDWKDRNYSIYARYIRIFNITIEVASMSGMSQHITDALPLIEYYGLATKTGNTFQDPVNIIDTKRKFSNITAYVGTRLVFKLNTGYEGNDNDWNKFNPRFDRLYTVDSQDITTGAQNLWSIGDANISTGVSFAEPPNTVTPQDYVNSIENAVYRVDANGDKYIKVIFRTYSELIIHNVYYNSSVRLPENLAVAKNFKEPGAQGDIFVKDNGLYDEDPTPGIIAIKKIPVKPGVDYDGVRVGDFGNRISQYLSANAILSSEVFQRGINLNGNSITNKVAQFAYYGTKANVVIGYDSNGSPITQTLESPISEYPFAGGGSSDAGDGTPEKPFLVETLRQLLNINSLYLGNIQGGQPTLRYRIGNEAPKGLEFKLIENIDLHETNISLAAPLCMLGRGFDGFLNGNNKALYDIRPTQSTTHNGLFARISNGGEVKDLIIGNFIISTSGDYAGVVAGEANDLAKIVNVRTSETAEFNPSTARVVGSNKFAGSLVGYLNNGAIIESCSVLNVQVQSAYEEYITKNEDKLSYMPGGAGGLVGAIGSAQTELSNARSRVISSNVDRVTVISKYASGGIAGALQSSNQISEVYPTIYDCVVNGVNFSDQQSVGYVGGIVGYIGYRRTVGNSILKANNNDITVYSRWSTLAYTKPVEPALYGYGGGGVAGINFGTIENVEVQGSNLVKLQGSISGGVVGINEGLIYHTVVTAQIRVDRARGGQHWRSGTFGGHVGYNGENGSVINVKTIYQPANYSTAFAPNSAAITVYSESAEEWADNFNVEVPAAPPSQDTEILGENPGEDSSILYVGGIVGYNKGIVRSEANPGGPGQGESLLFRGKIIVGRRGNAKVENTSYIGTFIGYNATSFATLDASTQYVARIESYRYNFVGFPNTNIGESNKLYMYDYIGMIGFREGNVAHNPLSTEDVSISCILRYEATGAATSDHTVAVSKLFGGSHAKDFPVSLMKYKVEGISNPQIDNPVGVNFDMGDNTTRNHAHLKPNIKDFTIALTHHYDYYGKYRQTIATPI